MLVFQENREVNMQVAVGTEMRDIKQCDDFIVSENYKTNCNLISH